MKKSQRIMSMIVDIREYYCQTALDLQLSEL